MVFVECNSSVKHWGYGVILGTEFRHCDTCMMNETFLNSFPECVSMLLTMLDKYFTKTTLLRRFRLFADGDVTACGRLDKQPIRFSSSPIRRNFLTKVIDAIGSFKSSDFIVSMDAFVEWFHAHGALLDTNVMGMTELPLSEGGRGAVALKDIPVCATSTVYHLNLIGHSPALGGIYVVHDTTEFNVVYAYIGAPRKIRARCLEKGRSSPRMGRFNSLYDMGEGSRPVIQMGRLSGYVEDLHNAKKLTD